MSEYHPLICFKPSAIHGTGGFAKAAIPPGTRIIEYVGEKIDKAESNRRCSEGNHFVFFLDEDFNLDGDVPTNPARALNHSCAPNCDAELIDGRIWIVARHAIQQDEEITFNYGYDLVDLEDHPCRCGSTECLGYIVAEEHHPELRRRRLRNEPR